MGKWSITNKQGQLAQMFKHSDGKFKAQFNRWGSSNNITHAVAIDMNDGVYIDDGNFETWIHISQPKF